MHNALLLHLSILLLHLRASNRHQHKHIPIRIHNWRRGTVNVTINRHTLQATVHHRNHLLLLLLPIHGSTKLRRTLLLIDLIHLLLQILLRLLKCQL